MRGFRELLDGDPECEDLLAWVDGCRHLDLEVYRILHETDGRLSVDEIAEDVDRDRSTTYRAVRRLHENGYLDREQVTYDGGGYCYRYAAVDPDEVAAHLEDRVESCHRELTAMVDEFRTRFA